MSFVLTQALTIKRIGALDNLVEARGPKMQNDDRGESNDWGVALMTAELDRMLGDLLDALGGEQGAMPQAAWRAVTFPVRLQAVKFLICIYPLQAGALKVAPAPGKIAYLNPA